MRKQLDVIAKYLIMFVYYNFTLEGRQNKASRNLLFAAVKDCRMAAKKRGWTKVHYDAMKEKFV